jgi:hypothetical protein
MTTDISSLSQTLSDTISTKIKLNKKKVEQIQKNLSEKHGINYGETKKLLNFFEEEKENMDRRVFVLLVKEVFLASGNGDLDPTKHFEKNELKLVETYDASIYKEEALKLPITLNNFLMIDDENYLGILDIKFLKKMFDADLIRYNYETQRNAKFIKIKGETQRVANITQKSVEDIAEGIVKGTLAPTQLTFNASVGTSDEGDELQYNAKKMELEIKKGTMIDILDGMHRLMGSLRALEINPEIEFRFSILVKNCNTASAQKFIGEINTVNVMPKAHVEAMKALRRSDSVVKQLQRESDLRISQTNRIHSRNNELVSSKILADTIDEEFKMNTKSDANEVGEYLTDFFNTLMGTYTDEFINKVRETREKSIINSNVMFAGYIVLAKRMREENIPLNKLSVILDKIDFSRDNKEWEDIGVIKDNIISDSAKKPVKNYFSNMKIEL